MCNTRVLSHYHNTTCVTQEYYHTTTCVTHEYYHSTTSVTQDYHHTTTTTGVLIVSVAGRHHHPHTAPVQLAIATTENVP